MSKVRKIKKDIKNLMYEEIVRLLDKNEKKEPERTRENIRLLLDVYRTL